MFVPIILGTAREGRSSEKVANFVLAEVVKAGIETELIDVRSYRIAATDNTGANPQAKELSPKFEKAAGFIIVSPEYNHGYPGELKMFLDMFYDQYAHKPLGICGVSMGPLGGARMVEQLRQIAVELHMIPIREALYFPLVRQAFDEKGIFKDAAAYQERIKKYLDELRGYVKNG